MSAQTPFLKVDSISLKYSGGETVVNNISFNLREGELGCLLGASGCGKTSVLRAISGFLPLQSGEIRLGSDVLSTTSKLLEPEKRQIGMVFQDHALFPHLSVADNIGFGLHTLTRTQRRTKVEQMADLVGLADHISKYPHELSGGQSQRVALARAVAPQPRLLLLDEPFSNLDAEMRELLGYEIKSLLNAVGVTALLVTHDQHEAFALCDHVGVMYQGDLLQWDTPFNLYHAPSSRQVAQFIGDGVFVSGQLINDTTVITNFGEVSGELISPKPIPSEVNLLIRPDDVRLDHNSAVRGSVTRKAFKGAQTLYTIKLSSADVVLALAPSHDDYEVGDEVGIVINADHLVCF